MSQKQDVVVIGDKNAIMGFKIAGVRRTYAIEEKDEDTKLAPLIKQLQKDDGVGIIAVTENLFDKIGHLDRDSTRPIILSIPKLERPTFPNVRQYYRELVTRILGFSIEL